MPLPTYFLTPVELIRLPCPNSYACEKFTALFAKMRRKVKTLKIKTRNMGGFDSRIQFNSGIGARFFPITGSPYLPAPARWAKSLGRSTLAVLRLITSSNFVGRSTGSSAGLAP